MYFYLFLIIGSVVDIFTKYVANSYLKNEIHIIGDYFTFKLIHNTGIAFSLPVKGILLKIVTVILLTAIFIYYHKYEKGKKIGIIDCAYGAILGGAIGNGIERILYSSVTDFLKIKYFAIFNFGDIFINIGVILLLYVFLNKKGIGTKKI